MIHLIYLSSATRLPTTEDLESLLEQARSKNARLDITGLLIYKDGFFLQVLEGEASEVDELYATILEDDRHENVITFVREPIDQREFADWSMAFRNLDLEPGAAPEGFNELFNRTPTDLKPYAGKVRAFLSMFADRL